MAEAALDIIAETGWSKEYVKTLSINFIASLHLSIQRKTLWKMGIVPGEASKARQQPRQARNSDKWATRQWEENIGAGKTRIHSRVNVNDLWNNPGLLNAALNQK